MRIHLHGVVDRDAVAPTVAFSSATVTKLRRPAGTYTLRLGLAIRDDVADNPVSYTLSAYTRRVSAGGVELARRFGTARTGSPVHDAADPSPHPGARTVRLVLIGEDPIGNTISVTRVLSLLLAEWRVGGALGPGVEPSLKAPRGSGATSSLSAMGCADGLVPRERPRLALAGDARPVRDSRPEVMLQQTQVERVIPRWVAWLERWPTPEAFAAASPADVIREWQGGLGYNRRALNLHRAACAWPRTAGPPT